MNELRTFHLFAGAGGGILADILLGHIPIGACEIEADARNILITRQRDGVLPPFPIWGDICTLDGKPWRGAVDVLCGGFPCQDISNQGANHGEKQGVNGNRSGLWKEYRRIIDEMQPRFVFAENSPNLRTRGLVRILKDLAGMGYHARWCRLGACDIGADHARKRIWLVAYRSSDRLERGMHCDKKRQREATIRSVERLCKNRVWHDLPAPNAFGAANGLARKLDRLRAVGNGQVPAVACLAWLVLTEGIGVESSELCG